MDLFAWLLLGHLVGDWMLQNDWMARGKGRHWRGVPLLVHCAIYSLAVALTARWASPERARSLDLVWFVTLVFGSHWLIDGFDLAGWWARRFRQTGLATVRLMNDQTLHLAVLVWAAGALGLGE